MRQNLTLILLPNLFLNFYHDPILTLALILALKLIVNLSSSLNPNSDSIWRPTEMELIWRAPLLPNWSPIGIPHLFLLCLYPTLIWWCSGITPRGAWGSM